MLRGWRRSRDASMPMRLTALGAGDFILQHADPEAADPSFPCLVLGSVDHRILGTLRDGRFLAVASGIPEGTHSCMLFPAAEA